MRIRHVINIYEVLLIELIFLNLAKRKMAKLEINNCDVGTS